MPLRPLPAPDSPDAPASVELQAAERHLLAFKPQLPSTDALIPYLRQIDQSRIYSNYGPLVLTLQSRLQDLFGLPANTVVPTGSGTAALMAGILAHAGRPAPERPLALCPAYTFVATAAAVRQCGYEPYLVDVSPDTWTANPAALLDHPMLARVGLVVPVCAYGRAIDIAAWEDFQQRTGVPVVVDAAAAIEAVADGRMHVSRHLPLALSFHATKAFGCGEGGCLAWADATLAMRGAQTINFGFLGSRNSQTESLNGKMSEYHAAVALAELDGWTAKRAALAGCAAAYRKAFTAAGLPLDTLITAPDIASNYVLYRLGEQHVPVAGLSAGLARAGIETRQWYGQGLKGHDILRTVAADTLDTSDRLAATLLGLPVACSLSMAQATRVARLLAHEQDAGAPVTPAASMAHPKA
ncbi:DegT/DnrJ/EryC1/StrS family aminotransferase [Novosphingobium sp. Leaf2]|uniref:DegT/DnrJ/EryC1/StrS family aminotransferase n=1 Tax=Novosphingobium sp. Leaf2 TaxID=1735670 RepID=UPI0006F2C2EE|nr:DegT/DnrJ/EryC1/StrS family aminotransferase [Novosphingobium sp. Leaf2]KQM18278.1 hypothetical protein ASE49_08615 [Novosphingobium sp. Leaf2]